MAAQISQSPRRLRSRTTRPDRLGLYAATLSLLLVCSRGFPQSYPPAPGTLVGTFACTLNNPGTQHQWVGTGTIAQTPCSFTLQSNPTNPVVTYTGSLSNFSYLATYVLQSIPGYRTESAPPGKFSISLQWDRVQTNATFSYSFGFHWTNYYADPHYADAGGDTSMLIYPTNCSVTVNAGAPTFDLAATAYEAPGSGPGAPTLTSAGQLTPPIVDLVATSLAWDTVNGGVDFQYRIDNGPLPTATAAKLFWATGTNAANIISSAPVIFTQPMPAGANGPSPLINVPTSALTNPPPGATYVLLELDPDNLLIETTKTNNTLALQLPDLAVTSMAWDWENGGLNFSYTNTGAALPQVTTAKLFWANGPDTSNILSTAILTTNIPQGFVGQTTNYVPEYYFASPASNATRLLLVLDPDNLLIEETKTNNTALLTNTFRHVVLVMMENRSFDHFLGWLPGAEVFQPQTTYTNATGISLNPWPLGDYYQGCGCNDPDHTYSGGRIEFNNGGCDGWLLANDLFSIGYYSQTNLPFFGQIATNWTVCDHYFPAIMAETQPNRIYQHCATTDSLTNRTDKQSILMASGLFPPVALRTIWDNLSQSNISCHYYYAGSSFLNLWGPTKYPPLSPLAKSIPKTISQFYADCENGTLPAVSFVDPVQTSASPDSLLYDATLGEYGDDTEGNDDHPHSDIRNGEEFLAGIYSVLASSPNWASTVFIINFDEWGGFFDHVIPPVLSRIDIPVSDQALGSDGRLGFRVPCVVISPWSRGRHISSEQFDHCSVLKMIENRWNLLPLTVHDDYANDLADTLRLDQPDFKRPPALANVPTGHFGAQCNKVQISRQPDGTYLLNWDVSPCREVKLQFAPTPAGPWTDVQIPHPPPLIYTPTTLTGWFRTTAQSRQ